MPDKAPARLMRLREKIEHMSRHNIDRMVCLRFDQTLAGLSPLDFVQEILVKSLGVQYLAVGDDFRFGKDRRGDFSILRLFGEQLGFEVELAVTCKINGRRVSSTWIREILAAGNLVLARQLLGRHYSISGRVVHGDKRGRALGYPTINIDIHRLRCPVNGIFATKVYGLGEGPIDAVTSIGTKPMFDGKQMILEAHLLDFNRDVYGRNVRVDLLKQLRKEQTFTTIDELKDQIEIDLQQSREFFEENNKNMEMN